MPRRDGTGPMGAGEKTGRGLGNCTQANASDRGTGRGLGLGLGLGHRRGFGRGFGRSFSIDQTSPETQKELLNKRKALLEDQLKNIDEQLENL